MQAAEEQREENAFFPVTRQLVIEWPKYGSKSNHEGDPGALKAASKKTPRRPTFAWGCNFYGIRMRVRVFMLPHASMKCERSRER